MDIADPHPVDGPADEAAAARGEAARAAHRLELARERISAARGHAGAGSGGAGRSGTAWGGLDDVDDEVRPLLTPAVDRISRLSAIAAAMADGTCSDESATRAAREIAAAQPHRRPR
ncbi:hypothetical protein [Dietzia alimentaria]|uniref:hypothetical protein n=1 Tax=Dietzia alimentaria TaxID=665550 RepID=UPI00029A31AB|nr:hypothetical protein [Dietzia alimentaria]